MYFIPPTLHDLASNFVKASLEKLGVKKQLAGSLLLAEEGEEGI